MKEGEGEEEAILIGPVPGRGESGNVGEEIALTEQGTFGPPGGAGSIGDESGGVGLWESQGDGSAGGVV